MKRRTLIFTIFPVYFFIIILSLVLVVFFSVSRFRDFHLKQTAKAMGAEIDLVSDKVLSLLERGDRAQLQKSVEGWGKTMTSRVTIIGLDGGILADSEFDPKTMDNHSDRSEFVVALSNGFATAKRHSRTSGRDSYYVAKRIANAINPIAVMRIAVPLLSVEDTFNQTRHDVLLVFVLVLLASGGASLFMAQRISRPLNKLKTTALAYAKGDLSQRMPFSETDEVAVLANSMHSMAENLDVQIQTVTRERNERDAILFSMIEGVLALDPDEKILNYNQATLDFFAIDATVILGKTLHEVFRHPDLVDFIERLLHSQASLETELVVEKNDHEKHIRAQGNLLRDAKGVTFGVLVVFHDITRLRELEGMRKNFVANVSHELKTPLTAIKGFVETLQEGAIADTKQAHEFLKIIAAQTDRLSETIQDLLNLSQIEREADAGQLQFVPTDVCQIVYSAIEICQVKANQKNIRILCEAKEVSVSKVNVRLLEQAVINLLDNAIHYSPQNSEIKIKVQKSQQEIAIIVQDSGAGIDKKHLARIFERFYRVDEARSRHLGGNGLGLAIVKHIAQAHHGRVGVLSEMGKGSVFSLHIPITG